MSEKNDESKVEVIRCHKCNNETDHRLVHCEPKEGKYSLASDYELQQSGRWSITSEAFVCVGCHEMCIRRTAEDSEADYPHEDFFPPRPGEEPRTAPKWVHQLPDGMDSLFEEVYTALRSRSYRLVAMGLRALMDELMNNTIGDVGGFEAKVKRMVADGYLSRFQKEVLDPTLELGHAAIHRGHQPSGNQIDAALGIVQGLLELFYVQKKAVEKLKTGVKPRQQQKPADKVDAAKDGKQQPTAVAKAKGKQSARKKEGGADEDGKTTPP